MSERYPPEPWRLAGTGWITAWRLPRTALPALPVGVSPVRVGGQVAVATAFVSYDGRGEMSYHELLAAVVVRRGSAVGLSITQIWVDSPASRDGGRELWGIPKELADFEGLSGADDAGPIASAAFAPRRGPRVPLPFPVPTSCHQTLGGRTVSTRLRASGRIEPARGSWRFDPEGALAWLAGARPLLSVAATDFELTFGPRLRQ